MSRRWSDFGMLLVLLVLCAGLSVATWTTHPAEGAAAAVRLAQTVAAAHPTDSRILVAAGSRPSDREFAELVARTLQTAGVADVHVTVGEPRDARRVLQQLHGEGKPLTSIAATAEAASWLVFADLPRDFPALGQPVIEVPRSYSWPTFLKADNLLNIANQISVIAILAIGMTLVILTAGIDLSVGSLIGLSAVTTCLLIERWGGVQASAGVMVGACLLGIAAAGFAGLLNGLVITRFQVPPFIVTLAMMLIARGVAYLLTGGETAYRVPDSFSKLGVGSAIGRIPNAAVLTLALYLIAHVVLSRTVMGRYLYAVGGNAEAARLSGVRVDRVLLFAYVLCGLLAGLGGVVMASQLKSGSPKFGDTYELYVIAAVVVGGASLSGGEGSVFGTLVGALITSVIQNGMNLLNVESNLQKVVLGCVILGAVLLDNLKRRTGARRG